jgi:ParB-like chromosome segregation protein Spo0J
MCSRCVKVPPPSSASDFARTFRFQFQPPARDNGDVGEQPIDAPSGASACAQARTSEHRSAPRIPWGSRVMKGTKELDFGESAASSTGQSNNARRKNGSNQALPGQAADRCRSVRISKILDPQPDRELDYTLVFSIAESARTIGFLHPMAVRKVQIERRGKLRTKTVLLAGAHRLAAARRLGYERIDCIYVEYDDDTSVQLVQVGEDLFRKQVTVLRRAELVTKWYELVAKDYVYGQVDRKNKRGRPPSGKSRIARDLFGISVDAWRKVLQRARLIAHIEPEAKQAAITAGLDDNQEALLAIAAANGRKAQLRKVAKLASPSDDDDTAVEPMADGKTAPTEKVANRRTHSAKPSHPETSFEQLEELWRKHFSKPWAYTPFGERERFIGTLRRARSKARTDAVRFVKDVFQGREKVYARDLYALAACRGLSKKSVRMVLNGLGYHRKRSGYGSSGRYYYRNINRSWKEELPVLSVSDLRGRQRKGTDDLQESDPLRKTGGERKKTGKGREETRPSQSAGISAVYPYNDDFPS